MSTRISQSRLETLLKLATSPPMDPISGSFREKLAYEAGRSAGNHMATRWTGAGLVSGFLGGILLFWLSMGSLPISPSPLAIPMETPSYWHDVSSTLAHQTGPVTDPAIWHPRTDLDQEMNAFGPWLGNINQHSYTFSGLEDPPLTIRSISMVLEDEK